MDKILGQWDRVIFLSCHLGNPHNPLQLEWPVALFAESPATFQMYIAAYCSLV
jgi:hypothetical protein